MSLNSSLDTRSVSRPRSTRSHADLYQVDHLALPNRHHVRNFGTSGRAGETDTFDAAVVMVMLPDLSSRPINQAVSAFLESLAELGVETSTVLRAPSPPLREQVLEVGAFRMDLATMNVEVNGRSLELRRQEYLLLKAFLNHPDQVLTRHQLISLARSSSDRSANRTVDVHVRRLRAKLGDHSVQLMTVRGFGYRLRA